MTATYETTLNDVNLPAVAALTEAVTGDRGKGATVWKATVDWKGAFRSEASIRDFAPLASDEPTGLGGTDTAPNPVEQLLGALGNCLAVGYAANATALDIELKDIRIDVEGDLDLASFLGIEPGHAGFDTIRAKVSIESDAPEAQILDLHERVTRSSPVGHTLARGIPVEIDLT